jgi:2-polyprenyl-3-methyl-5-hydroxy-6-metoxy-1,4-benzoquinol methylase
MVSMTAKSGRNTEVQTDSPPSCPVCGGHETLPYRQVFDDRFGHPDLFELVKCSDCGHLMTRPALRESDLAHLYGTYYPRKNITSEQVSAQAATVRRAFSGVRRWLMGVDNQGQYSARPGEKMLDVGCGSGLSLLEAKAMGVEAWGIEADPNAQRFAQQLGLRIHQGGLQDAPFADTSFDLVVLNQVIEHIPEPDQALHTARQRLAPNGRVILIFPNVNSLWCRLSGLRWINWHIPYHQHHFTLAGFTQMAQRCGFRVVRSRTITPNGWTLLQILANRQSIVRGEVNPMWQVKAPSQATQSGAPASLIPWKKLVRIPVMVLVGVANRLIDSLGYGDSLLVELRSKNRDK